MHNDTGYSFYGSGNCFGHYYSDDVYLGLETLRQNETKGPKMIHLKDYKFGVMERQKGILDYFSVDAIIGMGYPSLAEKNVTPIFDAIIQQNHLKHNVFAYSYVYKEESALGFDSELTIGYIDKSKYIEPLKWYPVVKKNFFTIQVDDILFNGKSYGICPKQGCQMTIDSGLTYMVASPAMYQIMENNNIVNPQECDPKTQIGNLTLVIKGDQYVMPPSDWQRLPRYETEEKNGTKTEKIICTPMISSMLLDEKFMFAMGNRFMRRLYTVYDRDTDRIGLAAS